MSTPTRVVVLLDPDAPTERLLARGLAEAERLRCPLHVRVLADRRLSGLRAGRALRFVDLATGAPRVEDPERVLRSAVARIESLLAERARVRWAVQLRVLPEDDGLASLASEDELVLAWIRLADASLRARRLLLLVR